MNLLHIGLGIHLVVLLVAVIVIKVVAGFLETDSLGPKNLWEWVQLVTVYPYYLLYLAFTDKW